MSQSPNPRPIQPSSLTPPSPVVVPAHPHAPTATPATTPSPAPKSAISHTPSSLNPPGGSHAGASPASPPSAAAPPTTPLPVEAPAPSKIRAFAQGMGAGHHQEAWKRSTNVTGTGATHVRSFHCRLATEGLEFLDKQINEWLDSHPDYEVKNVTITVGDWVGKVKEPNLIVQVWV